MESIIERFLISNISNNINRMKFISSYKHLTVDEKSLLEGIIGILSSRTIKHDITLINMFRNDFLIKSIYMVDGVVYVDIANEYGVTLSFILNKHYLRIMFIRDTDILKFASGYNLKEFINLCIINSRYIKVKLSYNFNNIIKIINKENKSYNNFIMKINPLFILIPFTICIILVFKMILNI